MVLRAKVACSGALSSVRDPSAGRVVAQGHLSSTQKQACPVMVVLDVEHVQPVRVRRRHRCPLSVAMMAAWQEAVGGKDM